MRSRPRSGRFSACQVSLCALLGVLLCAYSRGAPAPRAAGAAASVEKLHKAVGDENDAEAKTLADLLFQSPSPADRLAASLVYGRILLATNQKEAARQYLAGMKKLLGQAFQPDAANAAQLMEVYAAWLAFLDGREDEALKTLEQMLIDKKPGSATAEAADVLAILYLKRQERAAAKRAVDFGLAFVKYDKSGGGKIPAYIETLLKNRLKTDSGDAFPEAKKLYDQAEKLRQDGKFAEAGKVFLEISSKFPRSVWSHAAGFRIGQCLLGLNRAPEAQAHWRAFVGQAFQPDNAGRASRLPGAATTTCSPLPWRGQAAIALIDLTLQTELDVKTARELAHAAKSVLDKGPDEESKPSWHAATFDIRLRQGVLDLVTKHPEQAAGAFELAKKALTATKEKPPERIVAGLGKLIDAARTGWPLLPGDLLVGDAKLTEALAIATTYNLCARHEPAAGLFDAVIARSQRKILAPWRSFAALGEGSSLEAQGKPAEALEQFLASLKDSPDATWRDETLYRAATLIFHEAEAKSGPAAHGPDKRDPKKPAAPAKPPTPQERDAQANAAKERLAALRKARAAALPYWQEIVKRFPQSPRCEPAMYHAGVLLCEAAEAAPPEKADALWTDAAAMLKSFCEKYPKSPYLGDACVRRIDIALERTFDLKAAVSLSEQGIQWAKSQGVQVATKPDGTLTPQAVADAAKAIQEAAESLPAWADLTPPPARALLDDLYNLYLRAAILAYVEEKYDEAVRHLDAAGPARPADGMQARFDIQKVGLHILKVCSTRKEPAWNADAIRAAKSDGQKLALKLADTYLHTQRPEKAEAIYARVLAGRAPLGPPDKAVEGYCLMQLALTYSNQDVNHSKSIEHYLRFLSNEYADLPWAADAIMRLTVLEYHTSGDPRGAIARCQYIASRYPKHADAERASYFLALFAVQLGDKTLAQSSCRAFIERYPQSGWRNHVEKVLNDDVPGLEDREAREKR